MSGDEQIKIDLVQDRGAVDRAEADRQMDEAIAQNDNPALQRKIARNKKIFKWSLIGGGGALLVWGVYYLFAPIQSTMAYGICRVFLDRQVLYPETVRISSVESFESSVRIWYVQINSFGEYRLEPIQCYYRADPASGSVLDKVTINRREVDTATVEAFNKTIPAILAYPPDLSIPDPLPDSLEDLTIETDKFRKSIFGK
jgi:hypothetical protein